jgi:Tfp pilus assembly protein PilF
LAHNNLGVSYLQAGQYQQAIEQFQKTLQINPNYVGAQSNLELAKDLLQTQ